MSCVHMYMYICSVFLSPPRAVQVVNYGIGGHYEPHYDFARRGEDAFSSLGSGNRIATVLFYVRSAVYMCMYIHIYIYISSTTLGALHVRVHIYISPGIGLCVLVQTFMSPNVLFTFILLVPPSFLPSFPPSPPSLPPSLLPSDE